MHLKLNLKFRSFEHDINPLSHGALNVYAHVQSGKCLLLFISNMMNVWRHVNVFQDSE